MKNRRNGLFRSTLLYFFVFVVLIALVSTVFNQNGNSGGTQDIKSSTFITELQDKKIKDFNIQPSGSVYKVSGTYREAQTVTNKNTGGFGLFQNGGSTTTSVTHFTSTVLPNDATLNQIRLTAKNADVDYSTSAESQSGFWLQMLFYLVPTILVVLFFWFMMNSANQGGGGNGRVMSFGKSKAKPEDPKKNKVRFSDVAGAEEEKQELVEVVEFLKDPRKYSALGAHIPHGVLLEGPPGTGKTLLARAVAGEAGVPFFSISGSDFVEMFVGVGASRVRDLFENAKKAAPSIIFIDEIDAVGRQRGAGLGGGHDEREQTLNQLLVEMDGFTGNEGVIVIAATNRADVLDPALLRPGRFDRKVLVGRPDVKGREAILRVHAKNKPLAPDVDLKVVAQQTPGFVGADLENLLNEAALVAARRNKTQIDSSDIDEATDRVIAGPAKHDRVISPKERNMVAYHEAGHAIIGLVLNDSRTVRKVTIVPRGQAGGYAIMLPKDDQFLLTKKELNEQIVGMMGGRTAEEIIFGTQSTGASNDFEQATQIARGMVTKYGMTERLGTVTLESDSQPFVGAEYGQAPIYSQATAAAIDDEIRQIIDAAHKQAYDIIQSHREQHKAIAEALLKYETLNEKQILSLFNTGKMPSDESDEYPSEKSGTFEEAKKALEERDHEKAEHEGAEHQEQSADTTTTTPSSTAAENKPIEGTQGSEGDQGWHSAGEAPHDASQSEQSGSATNSDDHKPEDPNA
ncbi:ATP-dependent zinc metalloprotease FtsH [Schleiferilactobacillus perolens]|jgi:cell division protease FtsH|uniref:ATP-dependent zinc metalloprotease FtsH n=1 Tax=Schleiferilactobacillus perolens TaxID=100468 RepID=UPI0023552879|nr:ATP-dependent zinc metalloprotease FtsH [Schleiferilactobacillus perolens]MCI2172564.1 ATP-dependent zinc metalloprotease FtsH [Schleiferilactobacillus perolens]